MPRQKRVVIPNLPHHVTQRGVRRQDIFFDSEDRETYLGLFRRNCQKFGVEILAYCLMDNHVHHLLAPAAKESLSRTLQLSHKRYAEYLNARNNWSGHVWQERFYSSPVDEDYFWAAIRYIEQNPVRAKMTRHAAEYRWSSAAAHCGIRPDGNLTRDLRWHQIKSRISNWHSWLAVLEDPKSIELIRLNTSRDLPTGSESFLDDLHHTHQVRSRSAKMGRPTKKGKVVTGTTYEKCVGESFISD